MFLSEGLENVTKNKRSILEGIQNGIREVLRELERLINPDSAPQPTRVPVPVRPRQQRPYQR